MKKTKDIVLIAIYVAIAIVLDVVKTFIPFLNMPSGGSVNIALIPIVLSSFHLGIKKGMLIGLMWFVISSLIGLNKYFISFGQILFDYIIPSMILGISSLFYKKKTFIEIESGILIAMLFRTFSLIFSGAYYWLNESDIALSKEAWLSSFVYNFPYSLTTMVLLLIVIPIMLKTLKKYL